MMKTEPPYMISREDQAPNYDKNKNESKVFITSDETDAVRAGILVFVRAAKPSAGRRQTIWRKAVKLNDGRLVPRVPSPRELAMLFRHTGKK